MTELYPVTRDGELVGVIGTGGDATKLCRPRGGCRYYLWMNGLEAWEVTGLLDGRGMLWLQRLGGERGFVPLRSWTASPPYVHARAVADLDEYADYLARLVGRELRGKTVLLGFSGGKDSVAALVTLLRLQERVDFRLHVMYIHIPFLESPRSVRFVETVARRLGIEIDIREAPRRVMKTLLKWKGMPRRGFRFCTMYKARPMRELRKKDPSVIEVVGDRLTESPKRFERLTKALAARIVLAGRKFRPTYLFTLLDVVEIVRETGLIHPDYLDGIPRVACNLCPYRALYEFTVDTSEPEDPELIERVLDKMWRKWYSWTSYETFAEQRLWRFSVPVAKPLLEAKQLLAQRALEEGEAPAAVSARGVAETYRRVWLEGPPRAPVLRSPWLAGEVALRAARRGEVVALPGPGEAED